MSFEYEFPIKSEEPKITPPPKKDLISFKAVVAKIETLVDGGVNIKLSLAGDEYVAFAKLLAIKNQNKVLDVIASVEAERTEF